MANKRKYGIPCNVCGVYKITNRVTNDFYIGASVKINDRLSTHFGREARKNPDHPFYQAIREFSLSGFTIEVLEECDESKLLEKEQYYFDLLKPTYNLIRPQECHLDNDLVRAIARKHSQTPEKIKERQLKYQTDEYRELFKSIQKHRMRAVDMLKDEYLILTFESMSEANRWLSENTTYSGKNKVSKIKAVCDGERKTAYGYHWRYSKV